MSKSGLEIVELLEFDAETGGITRTPALVDNRSGIIKAYTQIKSVLGESNTAYSILEGLDDPKNYDAGRTTEYQIV